MTRKRAKPKRRGEGWLVHSDPLTSQRVIVHCPGCHYRLAAAGYGLTPLNRPAGDRLTLTRAAGHMRDHIEAALGPIDPPTTRQLPDGDKLRVYSAKDSAKFHVRPTSTFRMRCTEPGCSTEGEELVITGAELVAADRENKASMRTIHVNARSGR